MGDGLKRARKAAQATRKFKKFTDEQKLAEYLHGKLAKETPWPDWNGPMPDVVRLAWLDNAQLVLKLAKQGRL